MRITKWPKDILTVAFAKYQSLLSGSPIRQARDVVRAQSSLHDSAVFG